MHYLSADSAQKFTRPFSVFVYIHVGLICSLKAKIRIERCGDTTVLEGARLPMSQKVSILWRSTAELF